MAESAEYATNAIDATDPLKKVLTRSTHLYIVHSRSYLEQVENYMTIPQKSGLEKEDVLNVLREINGNPEMTQRELSTRLGISLGKINFILKALIQKGLVKAHNFKNSSNKKAYIYILTPSGIEAKARITYKFLMRKISEFEQLEEQIRLLKKEVGEIESTASTRTGTTQNP